jgi:hypothetical protein
MCLTVSNHAACQFYRPAITFFCAMSADITRYYWRKYPVSEVLRWAIKWTVGEWDMMVRPDNEDVCANGDVVYWLRNKCAQESPNAVALGSRKLMQYISFLGDTDRTKCRLTSFSAPNTHPNCSSTRYPDGQHAQPTGGYRGCTYVSDVPLGSLTVHFAGETMTVHHWHHVIQRFQINV